MFYPTNQTSNGDESTRGGDSASAARMLAFYLVIAGVMAATFIRVLEWAWRAISN